MTTSDKALTVVRPEPRAFPLDDIRVMAEAAASSGLFASIKSKEAAFTLMMLCQAEGLHPMQALRRFDIIDGKPAMKSDAMLAEFQARGGTVEWTAHDHELCQGIFTAPGGKSVTVAWSIEDGKRAGLAGKANWGKYPRQMLRARCISEGIRMTMPGVIVGLYTPEEVADFDDRKSFQAPVVIAVKQAPVTRQFVSDTGHVVNVTAHAEIVDAHAETEEVPVVDAPTESPRGPRVWMKRLQAAVNKLKLGAAEADAKGLRGAEREVCIRGYRLMYLCWCVDRQDIKSTMDLSDSEAGIVIQRAESGEVP